MDASVRCPRCHTDLVSSFPFGFAKEPLGPSRTYLCPGCVFLFTLVADARKPGAASPPAASVLQVPETV